jgi:pyruvate,water dikinase
MSKANYLQELQNLNYLISPFIRLKQVKDFDDVALELSKNKHFAVRSSANIEDSMENSFAGIFETYLNIPYELLYEYICKVFDFSKNDKLNFYLNNIEKDHSLLNMEVLIQEMIDCEKAGVAFSQNPINGLSEIHIESVWGIGERLVSGKCTGDMIRINGTKVVSYEVSFQHKMTVCSKDVGLTTSDVELINQSKKKLAARDIIEISELMKKLSHQFPFKFEIEWGFKDSLLYIFQLRPITLY